MNERIQAWTSLYPDFSSGNKIISEQALDELNEAVKADLGLWKRLFKRGSSYKVWNDLRSVIRNKISNEEVKHHYVDHSAYEKSTLKTAELFSNPSLVLEIINNYKSIWNDIIDKKGFVRARNKKGEGELSSIGWVKDAPALYFINDWFSNGFYHLGFTSPPWTDCGSGISFNYFERFTSDENKSRLLKHQTADSVIKDYKSFFVLTYYKKFEKEAYHHFLEAYIQARKYGEVWLYDPLGTVPSDVKIDKVFDTRMLKSLSPFIQPWSYDSFNVTNTSIISDSLTDRFLSEWKIESEFVNVNLVRKKFDKLFK